MANKFTGITSAGVNVPVYDKEAHQALGNVYTKSEVDTELNTKQDNLSTEQLYNIDHALTTSAGLASEAWVNNQGFAKESDIPTTAGLMEESKLSINSNRITAYNGIPFSAQGGGGGGGATYEGVAPIVVDNTENKISADTIDVNYQQFTHDDSLVHVSNDAQYALGVNTRMFRDETVLFSGSNTATCTLSEPLTNFECVKIYVSHDPNTIPMCCNEYDITKATQNLHVRWHAGTGNMYDYSAYISVNDKTLAVEKSLERRTTWAASPTLTYTVGTRKNCICKVVGIGRKGGN